MVTTIIEVTIAKPIMAAYQVYLLAEVDESSFVFETQTKTSMESKYKARLVSVGKAIRDSYIARMGKARFSREVLGGLAHYELGERWLWGQLQILAEEDESEGFDAQATWRALARR